MRVSTLAQLGFIVLASVAVFSFVYAARNDQRLAACTAMCSLSPNYAGRNLTAPDFELKDLDGKPVKLSSFRGQTVVLNFWTYTCEPCKEEMPSIAELAKIASKRDDFTVLTVSTDEDPKIVRETLQVLLGEEEIPFPVLLDPDAEIVQDKYGTKLFPETWIIDPEGVIRARFDGARDWSSAVAIEVAQRTSEPGAGCLVEFKAGQPAGDFAGICDRD